MKLINEIDTILWQLSHDYAARQLLNENIDIVLIKEIKHKNFIERVENWKVSGDKSDPHGTEVRSGYSIVDDSYIGTIKFARDLTKRGLSEIQASEDDHSVSSIGFNNEKQRWSGWSHRAISSFGVGDMLFDAKFGGDLDEEALDKMPFIERGAIKITELEQAKKAASNFAKYVS